MSRVSHGHFASNPRDFLSSAFTDIVHGVKKSSGVSHIEEVLVFSCHGRHNRKRGDLEVWQPGKSQLERWPQASRETVIKREHPTRPRCLPGTDATLHQTRVVKSPPERNCLRTTTPTYVTDYAWRNVMALSWNTTSEKKTGRYGSKIEWPGQVQGQILSRASQRSWNTRQSLVGCGNIYLDDSLTVQDCFQGTMGFTAHGLALHPALRVIVTVHVVSFNSTIGVCESSHD